MAHALTLLTALLSTLLTTPTATALPAYNIQILDVPGWLEFTPAGLSDNGTIVGTGLSIQGFHHALALQGDNVIDLHVPGYSSTYANAVNDSFQVAGRGDPPGLQSGVSLFWDNGLATALPSTEVPGAGGNSAVDVNEVGMVLTQNADLNGGWATLFANGTEYRPPFATFAEIPVAINGQGAVLISQGNPDAPDRIWRPLVDPATITELPVQLHVKDINDQEQVVGSMAVGTPPWSGHAFRWDGLGQLVDLHQPQWLESEALAINNVGVTAGLVKLAPQDAHAVLWGPNGDLVDLHQEPWMVSQPVGINNQGWVVGIATLPDYTSLPFLATPVPEPGSLVLIATAVGLLAVVRRRGRRTDAMAAPHR